MDRTWAARELTPPGQAPLQEDTQGLVPQSFPFTHSPPHLQSVLCLESFIPETTQLTFHESLKMHLPLEALSTHLSSSRINFQILGEGRGIMAHTQPYVPTPPHCHKRSQVGQNPPGSRLKCVFPGPAPCCGRKQQVWVGMGSRL